MTFFYTPDRGGEKYLALSTWADSLGEANPAPAGIGYDENYGVIFPAPDEDLVVGGLVSGLLVGAVEYTADIHQALLASWVKRLQEPEE